MYIPSNGLIVYLHAINLSTHNNKNTCINEVDAIIKITFVNMNKFFYLCALQAIYFKQSDEEGKRKDDK